MKKNKKLIYALGMTTSPVVASAILFTGAISAHATGSAVDEVTVTVPVSCSLTRTVGSAHTAIVEPGTLEENIGETTFKVLCNDSSGFSVYAIGYSDDTYGNTTMKPSTLSASNGIATGTANRGFESYWAMKLSAVSGDYAPTLENGFDDYHAVPDEYTKVVSLNANTDAMTGSSFKSTYAAFISQAQPADTYTGKVKYTIVHPANANTPLNTIGISDLTYLQEFKDLTEDEKTAVLSSMDDSTTYTLADIRDGKTYAVAKLKDGKIWMAENLDLGRTDLTNDLTSSNTNLSATITAATFNGWKKSSGSATYEAGEFISVDGMDVTSNTAYGTLYNYYAVSAGTISGNINTNNAQNDICPAGWRLPTGGETGEFASLYSEYNSFELMRAPITNGGAAFTIPGGFYDDTPIEVDTESYYWGSTNDGLYDSMDGLALGYGEIGLFPATREFGFPIRCVAK